VKDLYNENYKVIKKKQKTLEEGRNAPVHGLAESILLKWAYY
jgi:hypothetical protein